MPSHSDRFTVSSNDSPDLFPARNGYREGHIEFFRLSQVLRGPRNLASL